MRWPLRSIVKTLSWVVGITVAVLFVLHIALPWVGGYRDARAADKLAGWEPVSATAVAVEPVFGSAEGGGFINGPTLNAQRPVVYRVEETGERQRVIADAAVTTGDTTSGWYRPSSGEVILNADLRISTCDRPDNGDGGCGEAWQFLWFAMLMLCVFGAPLSGYVVGYGCFTLSDRLFVSLRHRRMAEAS